ncbi:hypothetical protein GCM10009535_15090 [Streptomyces thermocarboxydovorans]|uniref:Uncharacterized protein n=1 Tax=Streptomyces thermocarboxydovorans TaxID=59298 RepID=A0ABN1HDG4_9ACTN
MRSIGNACGPVRLQRVPHPERTADPTTTRTYHLSSPERPPCRPAVDRRGVYGKADGVLPPASPQRAQERPRSSR